MTATTHGRRPVNTRSLLYLALALAGILPVLVFAVAGVSSSDFSLKGPGGPALAFSAGVLSFVSPCVLPLVPIYLTHLSGASFENGRVVADRRVTFTHALVFVSSFSLVFIALGTAAGLAGTYFLQDNQRDLGQFAGFVLVVMGVLIIPHRGRQDPIRAAILLLILTAVYFFLADVAQIRGDRTRTLELGIVLALVWLRFAGYFDIPFLSRTFEVNVDRRRKVGYTRSALIGGAFAFGWTPCIGPILSSILVLAADSDQAFRGTYLLVAYSAGLSIPFLIAGLALSDATTVLRRIQRYSGWFELAAGLIFVTVGVLLITGRLTGLNSYFSFADFNGGL